MRQKWEFMFWELVILLAGNGLSQKISPNSVINTLNGFLVLLAVLIGLVTNFKYIHQISKQ